MHLPPIFYHYFQHPLPYARALALQERIHAVQLLQRKRRANSDVLLLLQHSPVYTAGRRQTDESVQEERTRLTAIGADFVTTARGGELTYHGPGQLVGYPLLDLGRTSPPMGIREYICRMQKTLAMHLEAHGIETVASEHTGVFLNATTKIASIGVQVRHRLTNHGFALNITAEPLRWFEHIVACGLADVKAGSLETALQRPVRVENEISGLVRRFGLQFEREMLPLDIDSAGEIGEEIAAVTRPT